MSNFAKLAATLAKNVGENDPDQDILTFVDTGFAPLNHAISGRFDGGLPCGRIVEIFGPESSGKTWIATQTMINAQKAGGAAGFCDHERSFKLSLAKKIGLDDTPGAWNYYKPRTYEESVEKFIKAVRIIRESGAIEPNAPIVWVFDSLASMIPAQMVSKDASQVNMNDSLALAKLTSTNFKVLASIADEYNVLVIFLNQIREKPGVMYGDPTTTPGGKAPKFYASVRIQLGASRMMKDVDGEKMMIGSEVTARCIKNKINRPYLSAKWKFMFNDDGSGRFALIESLLDFAISKDILPTGGSRVSWIDGKTYFASVLARKIESEGLLDELQALIANSNVETDESTEDRMEDDE